MFDMGKVGQNIARLRKDNNMTQMELADRLDISFQAVSNWERGNSMPDISKLPELAELFHTTVDQILGKENPVLTAVAAGEPVNLEDSSVKELSEALTLLKPRHVTELAEKAEPHTEKIGAFLPFMAVKDIRELANRYLAEGKSIHVFLPFMSYEDVDSLAERFLAEGKQINAFLPFLSDEKLESLFARCQAAGKPVTHFLPFLSDKRCREQAFAAFEKGGIKGVSAYLPFLDEKDIKTLLEKQLQQEL